MVDINISESPLPKSPVMPAMFEGDKVIQFQCHKGIACFNACCSNIDITLTPYDILRLKKRLDMSSGDFLNKYTFPYETGKDDVVGVKFKPVENGMACQFMTAEGCSVYEDRPAACRYYPVALLSMRKQNEFTDTHAYAFVQEKHCLGHNEPRQLTIDEYRKEQGVAEYDELTRGWRQLILKKKSSGPYIGATSLMSRQLFFMACYDLDNFRKFVSTPSFNETYDLPADLHEKIKQDDTELMLFGFRLLAQVLFNEISIPLKPEAMEKRLAKKQERQAAMDEITAKIDPAQVKPAEMEDKYKFVDN